MDPISLNAVQSQGSTIALSKKIDDVTIKPTTNSANGQNAANEANSYNKYDTMELSREYVGYRTKSENSLVNSDTQQLNSTIDQELYRIPSDEEEDTPEKKEKKPRNTNEDETEEKSISNNQLGGYTNSELKGLVLSGKITTLAYNTEMKNRQDDSQPVDQQTQKPLRIQSNKRATNSIF